MAALTLVVFSGCGEWDKYWKDSGPVAPPASPPDTTAPEVSVMTITGTDTLSATPVSGEFIIEIQARDDRAIESVQLTIDGKPAVLWQATPFSYEWDTTRLEEGSVHVIWARAVDASENATTSDTVYAVVFNAGPRVVITAPAAGARVRGEITLAAESVDPRAPIARLHFLLNGMPVAILSQAPFQMTWNTAQVGPGEYFLSAMAFGENGEVGISPLVRLAINNSPPRVKITFPETGRAIASGGTALLSATAVDTLHGSIGDRLVWVSDLDGEIGHGPRLLYRGLRVGEHAISVTATNAWELAATDRVRLTVRAAPTYDFCADLYLNLLYVQCFHCHNPGSDQFWRSDFDMTTYNKMMAGGRSLRDLGIASIVPCRPESSLVYMKIYDARPRVGDPMPPPPDFSPLTPEQIQQIRIWIHEGAPIERGRENGCD